MKFRILRPLEVSDEGGRVSLGGGKRRALLAVKRSPHGGGDLLEGAVISS
jgi:hypothetical protein